MDVRSEYPFQVSYEDARLPGSLICLRAETAEDLGRQYVEVMAVLDSILGPLVQQPAPDPSQPAQPATPKRNVPIAKLPREALEALAEQGRALCACDRSKAKWWDNRQAKTNPRQPDFKCTVCGYGVWLTPPPKEPVNAE
jgi:hypothetical protein